MLRSAWYVAAWSEEVARRPLGRLLLGRWLALFRDASGKVRALDGTCPHRGADLAAGRVVDGTLECPFHGWRFAGDGRCVRVPSQPASATVSERSAAATFLVREQHGLVWLWGGARPPDRDPPRDEAWDSGRRRFRVPADRWPAPHVQVVEHALDQSHHAFVHRRSMGGAADADAAVAEARVVADADGGGFSFEEAPAAMPRSAGVARGVVSRVGARVLGLGPVASRRYRFDLGGSVRVRIDYTDGRWDVSCLHATPADEATTWVFGECLRTRAPHVVGELFQRRFFRALMAEDRAAAELLLDKRPGGHATNVSVVADHVALSFRKLYERALERDAPLRIRARA